jgi:hypothetical protein
MYDSSSKKKSIKADRFIPHTVSKNLFSLFNPVKDNSNPHRNNIINERHPNAQIEYNQANNNSLSSNINNNNL